MAYPGYEGTYPEYYRSPRKKKKEKKMSVTLREIDWDRSHAGEVHCPTEEHRNDISTVVQHCNGCRHWRWFARDGARYPVISAVSELGLLATHVQCAYPEKCKKCGCDGTCGRCK